MIVDRGSSGGGGRSTTLDIAPAADHDLRDVVTLLNRAYRGSGAGAGWTTEDGLLDGDRISEPTLRQEISDKPEASLLVWKPEGSVEGCVWLEPAGDDVWYLGSFAIEPRRQNGGCGRRLLRAAEDWVWTQGGRAIEMTVIDARTSLIAWYVRRGYRATGRTEPFHPDTRFGMPKVPDLRFAVLTKALSVR